MQRRLVPVRQAILGVACTLATGLAFAVPLAGAGVPRLIPCALSQEDAAISMNVMRAIVIKGNGSKGDLGAGSQCEYAGSPKQGAAPTKGLTIWVSDGGLPGLQELKTKICWLRKYLKTDESIRACGAATEALKERDPIRLVRALFIAAQNSGDATAWSSHLGGNPGYLWDPEPATKLTGSSAFYYVERLKRFVSITCIAIYAPFGRDSRCASEAADRLYVDLTN